MSEQTVQSIIRRVTVFEAQAQVHRVARATLATGLNTLVFEDLPQQLDQRSLQVAIGSTEGQSDVTMRGVVFAVKVTSDPGPTDTAVELQKATVKQLEDSITANQDALAAVEQLRAFIDASFEKAVTPAKDDEESTTDTAMWQRLIDVRLAEARDASAKSREIRQTIAELQDQLTKENAVLKRLTSGKSTTVRSINTVCVNLSCASDGVAVEVQLSFVITTAKWTAGYDVRIDTKKSTLLLQYFGLITQSTGQDWTGVEIECSTARPNVSGKQPDLTPWRVSLSAPPPPSKPQRFFRHLAKASRRSDSAPSAACDLDVDEGECDDGLVAAPMAISQAKVSDDLIAMSFTPPGVHSIRSDGRVAKIPLTQLELPCTVKYTCVPKLQEAAFAVALAKNTSEFALLPGEITTFVDGKFICRATLPKVNVGDEFSVNMGIDDQISVKYKVIQRQKSRVGTFITGQRTKFTFQYQLCIKNNKAWPIIIKVNDQFPKSHNSDIVVEHTSPPFPEQQGTEPRPTVAPWAEGLNNDGTFQLISSIAPGEGKTSAVAFTVEYTPWDQTVKGL